MAGSKMWRFPMPWDYHELGAFLVLAPSAKRAAAILNEFIAQDHRKSDVAWWPGKSDKASIPGDWTADDAEEVGPVYVQGGCDD